MNFVDFVRLCAIIIEIDKVGEYMKIAFDLHGVLEKHPDKFKNFMCQLINNGHEIWILSGPPVGFIETELTKLKIEKGENYHKIASIVDFLLDSDIQMWLDEHNRWWTDDYNWWSAKAKICKKNDIDILIDDSLQYGVYFNGSAKFFHLKDNNFDQIKQIVLFLFNN